MAYSFHEGSLNASMGERGIMSFKDIFLFDRMIAPTLIKVLYWIGLAGVVLAGLGIMFTGGPVGGGMGGGAQGVTLSSFLSGVFYIIFAGLFWRVVCELLIIVFQIHERLKEMRDNGKGSE